MSEWLPETVKVDPLTEQGRILQGKLALSGMGRLTDHLYNSAGEVGVELEFGIDAQKIKFIQGHISTLLELVCQRCLKSLAFPVDVRVSLGLVKTETEAQDLPEMYEPLIQQAPELKLSTLIEDELLLALPIVPTHSTEECHHRGHQRTEIEEGRQRPFANLAELMNKE